MPACGRFVVARDHASLTGHFPGQPVVPGVVLLDQATASMLEGRPGWRISGFSWVKFLAAVLPDEVVEVAAGEPRSGQISFLLRAGPRLVLEGVALIERTP